MKITISKAQWETLGKQAGWYGQKSRYNQYNNYSKDDKYNALSEKRDKAIAEARKPLRELIDTMPQQIKDLYHSKDGYEIQKLRELLHTLRIENQITPEDEEKASTLINRLIDAKNMTSYEYADERGWRSISHNYQYPTPEPKPAPTPQPKTQPKQTTPPDTQELLAVLDSTWTKDKSSPEYESLKQRIQNGEYKSKFHLINSIKKRL